MAGSWHQWVPVLKVDNARKSIQFYCDQLGFEKDWEHQFDSDFPLYVSVSKDDCCLHLSEHGEAPTNITLIVGVEDVDAAYKEICDNGCQPKTEPQNQPYGTRDFSVQDPDGHNLIVSMALSNFDDAPGRTNDG